MNITNAIDSIIRQGEIHIRINEGDYINDSDGLLYCGKCHTAKQTRVQLFGIIRHPMCLCKCESEKLAREEEERKRQEFESKVKELRKIGFPDCEMQKWNFANDDLSNEQITKAMQRYVDHFAELRKSGKGLLLYGPIGTGKTYAACEVANALIDKGYSVLVTNFSRILNALQGTFEKQDYIDRLNRFQLLIVDDLGIERSNSEFAKEQIYNVIDSRYRACLPMIITTNLSIEKIKNPDSIENSRIYDRIIERCFPIQVNGRNRRRKAVCENYDDLKAMLGI